VCQLLLSPSGCTWVTEVGDHQNANSGNRGAGRRGGFERLPIHAATADCSDATNAYNSAISDVSDTLRRYTRCLSSSNGSDDCSSEFRRLKMRNLILRLPSLHIKVNAIRTPSGGGRGMTRRVGIVPFTPETLAKRARIVPAVAITAASNCGSLTTDHPSGTESLKAGWKRAGSKRRSPCARRY
jgi:hypothetical protein